MNPLRLPVIVQVRSPVHKRLGWCLYTFIVLFHVCTHRTKQQYEHSCSSQCSRDVITESKKRILFIWFIYKYLFMLSVWQHVSMLAIQISWYNKRLLYFTLNFPTPPKKPKSYIFKQSTLLLPRFRLWQSIYKRVTLFSHRSHCVNPGMALCVVSFHSWFLCCIQLLFIFLKMFYLSKLFWKLLYYTFIKRLFRKTILSVL